MNFNDLLQMIDPVKWADDAVTGAANGEGVLLTWDSTTHTGADVERLLRSYGVACYGRKYPLSDDPTAGCHVRKAQAKYADGLLRGHGVAVLSPQLSAPIRPRHRWGVDAKPQGFGGIVGDMMGVMDGARPAPIRQRPRRGLWAQVTGAVDDAAGVVVREAARRGWWERIERFFGGGQ
jgi:hypothetical protein